MIEVAQKTSGDYWKKYNAARPVADKIAREHIRPVFRGVRDELDRGLMDLIRRMAAYRGEPA